LGECLSHTQTAPRDASSNGCFQVKKPATPWRQRLEAGWVPSAASVNKPTEDMTISRTPSFGAHGEIAR
jgi:hypothetical protein